MSPAGRFIAPANTSQGRIYFLRHGAVHYSGRQKHHLGLAYGSLSIVDVRPPATASRL